MLPPKRLVAAGVALILGVVAGACWRALALLPPTESPLYDPRTPVERLFTDAKHVRSVQILVYANNPKQRIIQVDDAHYVTLADFAREARETSLRSGIKVTDEEINRLYCSYVDDLLDLRDDQLLFLRWLVDRYSLNCVFYEGLSEEDVAAFLEGAALFNSRKSTLSNIANTMRQLPRFALKNSEHAISVNDDAVEAFLWDSIYYGSVGRLALERPEVKVLAPEERVALEEAYLATRAGENEEKAKVREAIIVKRLLKHQGCSVIVLGAGHNLAHEIRHQSHGECDYVKITPARFPAPPLSSIGGGWPLNGAGSAWDSVQ